MNRWTYQEFDRSRLEKCENEKRPSISSVVLVYDPLKLRVLLCRTSSQKGEFGNLLSVTTGGGVDYEHHSYRHVIKDALDTDFNIRGLTIESLATAHYFLYQAEQDRLRLCRLNLFTAESSAIVAPLVGYDGYKGPDILH